MKIVLSYSYLAYSILAPLFLLSVSLVAQDSKEKIRNLFFSDWQLIELLPGGRFDAVANLDGGVFLIGSRGKENPGKIFRSADYGDTWSEISNQIDDEITCIANGRDGIAYLLTGTSLFYISQDHGLSWSFLGQVSQNRRFGNFKLSYGIAVTPTGTILISDTDPEGGHIFRSVDQGRNWTDLGKISSHALYRFEQLPDYTIVNGWDGTIYRSMDDGLSWSIMQKLENGPLYATEHLEHGVLFQATESGNIYRSQDHGESWRKMGSVAESADDFVSLTSRKILLSTYTKEKTLYVSGDIGQTWESLGPVNPALPDDWLDHVISYEYENRSWLIGCTNKGFMVKAQIVK